MVEPKTMLDKASDLMHDILAESTTARKKSMALGAFNYAGELSAQLMKYAQSMEKHYKVLQRATANKVEDEDFLTKRFAKVEADRVWFKQAEARVTK